MHLVQKEWTDVLRREYLQGFIRAGGSAVKFVTPMAGLDATAVTQALRTLATEERYHFVHVDAARTKVHMIDHVFHEIARQTAWNDLAYTFVSRLLEKNGLRLPAQRERFTLSVIAELNGREPHLLKNDLREDLEQEIFRDYRMSQEFRIAMIRLCRAQLEPAPPGVVPGEQITSWLRGELRRISELKWALIFQKVARHNARDMLSSLSHWLHLTGYSGLVLVLDIGRCLVQRPRPLDPGDTSLYYSTGAVLDTYEMLRQLVDETDDMEYCLVIVLAPPEFLQPDCRRGVQRYQALNMRIWDEVRDRYRANPFACLVRLVSVSSAGNDAKEATA